jgi:hypothetical protein
MVAHLKKSSWRQYLEDPREKTVFKDFQSTKQQGSNTVIPLQDGAGVIQVNKDKLSDLLFSGTSVVDAPIDISDIEPSPLGTVSNTNHPPASHRRGGQERHQKDCAKKSPGIDGIHNEYLKVMSSVLTPIFQLLSTGCFPEEWKCAITAILRKANKGNYSNPTAYRPIALLSGVSKLLELILARRVAQWAKSSCAIATGHFGGRTGVGTEDAIYWLDQWVKRKWSKGKIVASLFLDFKSVYPSVNPTRMVDCLINKNCPLYMCRIIQLFLTNRSTKI